jgi:hypothetical protein
MLRATRAYYMFCALDFTFANDRLRAEGIAAPPALPDYLGTCLANSGEIVEQFIDDLEMFTGSATAEPLPLTATA